MTKLNKLKPDIMLAIPPCRAGQKTTILIVEIKRCQDTKPEDQLLRCQTQHSELECMLRKEGYAVTTLPILVGHGGTITMTLQLDLWRHSDLTMEKQNTVPRNSIPQPAKCLAALLALGED